jgi:hypothetical protein
LIILDTNVVSELMRPEPHPAVFAWINSRPKASLHTTTVTQAEVLYGVALLPAGRRRDSLAAAAKAIFSEDFPGRVLPFDAAAENYAEITAARRRAGSPIEPFDAQIAAIALANNASLATRDTADLADCGVVIIDPWRAERSAG